jgi:hypothetical protein
MKLFLKPTVAALLAMSLAITLTAHAEKKEKAEPKGEAKGKAQAPGQLKPKGVPYAGTLSAKTAESVTIKKKVAEKTFTVTSATKITKAGKPATLADATVGEEAAVYAVENEAKSLRLGAKPEKTDGEKKEKKEKKSE